MGARPSPGRRDLPSGRLVIEATDARAFGNTLRPVALR